MRPGLFLATLIGLAGAAHVSSAADATWVAVEENNPFTAWCGTSRAAWHVVIKGNTLTFTSQRTKLSETVDLKGLQPDGSGKVVGKDDKNREFYVTFDPGSGARPFYVTSPISHCRYAFMPKA